VVDKKRIIGKKEGRGGEGGEGGEAQGNADPNKFKKMFFNRVYVYVEYM
jgi:hypothetical protein